MADLSHALLCAMAGKLPLCDHVPQLSLQPLAAALHEHCQLPVFCPKAERHRNVASRPAARLPVRARRPMEPCCQANQSKACPQGHSSSSSKPGVLSSFGSRPRLGASRLPLLRKARSGRPAEIVPDSPSVLSKHRSPSVLLTHLTRDGRPTGSTCPPWPRPMGAPGVAGVGGPPGADDHGR